MKQGQILSPHIAQAAAWPAYAGSNQLTGWASGCTPLLSLPLMQAAQGT